MTQARDISASPVLRHPSDEMSSGSVIAEESRLVRRTPELTEWLSPTEWLAAAEPATPASCSPQPDCTATHTPSTPSTPLAAATALASPSPMTVLTPPDPEDLHILRGPRIRVIKV
ncbi:hypothetical protein [Streptomyces graminofaciens]|uniref:hypothetical protein n=1 Tax=Streptomyces graminofaciens TaxID=68212 RepID=UPI00257226E0|nr:hypothetical protein [Streptomyces graminofaciens]